MKNNNVVLHYRSLFLTVFFLFTYSVIQAQYFQLGSGLSASHASANGSVVVGDNGAEHFMWTESGGVVLIGGVAPSGYGGRTSISGDGSLIAGTRINPNNNLGELSSYEIASQTWTSHGSLGSSSGNSASSAWGISSDGSAIVGLGWVNAGSAHAIKYTNANGVEDLGSTVANRSTRANVANMDGTIIGGWQDSASGFRQGAIWTNGVQSLLTHPNGNQATEVGAMSEDGLWVGGGQGFANNYQAWIWSQATGIVDIGPAPVSGWRGATTGLTSDGSIVVGFYRPFPAPATFGNGFIYTDDDGLIDLNTYASSLGIDTQGAILALPLGISDDGSTIYGVTNNGAGFVLKVPVVPSNNGCAGAIEIVCDDVVTGSTVNATDSGGGIAPDVFYSYEGSGTLEDITLSLCDGNTDYDSVIRVYSDCTLATEIASNDDFCGVQSELTFESDGSSTYYIMIEGAGSEVGNYSLEISCEPTLGIQDTSFNGFVYYPNPVENELHIQNGLRMDTIAIYTILGQNLVTTAPKERYAEIDLSKLPSGIYFANVTVNNETKTFKFVK